MPGLRGEPDNRAVPLLPAVKVTPEGSVPDRVIFAAGYPAVVMLNENV